MKTHVRLRLTGKVQGVGLRPFVSLHANRLSLLGYALNKTQGLDIFLLGDKDKIEQFEQLLIQHPPKHADISHLEKKELSSPPSPTYQNFEIRQFTNHIENNHLRSTIPADRAICKSCVSELFTPSNKRFLYPFITCVECGPRASIIKQLPYERFNTTYDKFTECEHCSNETSHLVSSQTQRFHSQTNACWQCGPSLELLKQGKPLSDELSKKQNQYAHYIDELTASIKTGNIIALKGLSGFHLVCDARNPQAIKKLRAFKHRPEKPFAIMALNMTSLTNIVQIDDQAAKFLESPTSPIVLLPKRALNHPQCEALAPNVSDLGCMLPYTGLHYLLFYALIDKPRGESWLDIAQEPLLAITSANISGEPLISSNQECIEKMSTIAEYILCHDRDITLSCDDSVIQSGKAPMIFRRARGFAPEPISLPFSGKPVLALGAHLKHTFCLSDGQQAFLSPHLGEPKSISSYERLESTLNTYLKKLHIQPEIVACDCHPDFFSHKFAKDYAEKHKLPFILVPHHQAHLAAVLPEIKQPINSNFIGLALDGIGLGEQDTLTDSSLWGGELFLGKIKTNNKEITKLTLQHCSQISSLSLPGGDKAVQDIARIGYALVDSLDVQYQSHIEHDFSLPSELKEFIHHQSARFPRTSSLGRWFDAISSILGIRQQVSYEGQAAMELEALAEKYGTIPATREYAIIDQCGNLDLYPILPAILNAQTTEEAAAIFHAEIVDGLLRWLLYAANKYKTNHIVCAGGCFQNRIIRHALIDAATEKGLIIHYPQQVPVNDASISLGQVLLASLHQT